MRASDPAASATAASATPARPRPAAQGGAVPGTTRIGPNAITRTVEALALRLGDAEAAAILHAATGRTPATLPVAMVEEREVQALVHAVHGACGEAVGRDVLWDAGTRTADYLRAVRIPRLAQRVIAALPRRWGAAMLLRAMGAHAWTFAGSGRFAYAVGGRGSRRAGDRVLARLQIAACPMCRGLAVREPACAFYAAAFERLLRALVDERVRVREVACEALGAGACAFEAVIV